LPARQKQNSRKHEAVVPAKAGTTWSLPRLASATL
jgi:hypothetical protein